MWGWKPEKKEKWKNCTLRKIEQNNLKIWQVEKQKKSWKKLRFDELNEMENDCK